jgi:hypothetical protein
MSHKKEILSFDSFDVTVDFVLLLRWFSNLNTIEKLNKFKFFQVIGSTQFSGTSSSCNYMIDLGGPQGL